MVFIKVSLGQELRRFSADKGSTNLESLKTTIKSLFPPLAEVEDINNLHVFYRDSEGDLIAVSSDHELQTALSDLGDSDTLRVVLRVSIPPPTQRKEEEEEEEEDDVSFGDLFHSLHSLFDDPFHHHHHHGLFGFGPSPGSWFGRQHAMRLHEEKIRQQRLYEEKMRKARMEQVAALREKAQKEQEELRKKAREERRKSQELQQQQQGDDNPLVPKFPPGWKVDMFGSWEPVTEEGDNFSRKSWGPYGYVAYYNPQGEKKEDREKKEDGDQKEDGDKKEEGQEGMETASS